MAVAQNVIVGVGDCGFSSNVGETLVTYALGSCVAVSVHDPVGHVGGLLHFMLPESSLDPEKAVRQPYMFADTGVPLLFEKLSNLGAEKKRLQVKVAGGAQMIEGSATFNIGKRNALAVKKLLWKAGVMIQGEELGGTVSRSIMLEIGTGKVSLKEVQSRGGTQ
ncbi:MAG: chemotaxis protein CheD [Acidobacteria bacterium]|nr:chemotaxis protein CheD [Acidobacteriota bacterium]